MSTTLDKSIPLPDSLYDLSSRLEGQSEETIAAYFESTEFVFFCKETFGLKLPYCFIIGNDFYRWIPSKQGIPMDWEYFSELKPITKEVINNETNIEKRRLLIMEYGVNNYLSDVQTLHSDEYGTLIRANFEGESQQFVRVRNGTEEPEENKAYLKEKGMLTDDGHKIYYLPVSNEVSTAKEGVEESWALPPGTLPNRGWDYET